MTVAERFAVFFSAINGGQRPYPWQTALVTQVADTGRWPAAISAPTGAGKSSVIDVHVFLVAERARAAAGLGAEIARPPRRLVLVSPRRVLVDDQHERAQRLAEVLADPERHGGGVLTEVADALSGLLTSGEVDAEISPLGVIRLRGGVLLDLTWRLDPARCQVICATPQMWGSRLLLRGYRGSRRSRNLEAGLLGHDVTAIIDEAHLHGRLVETARVVSGHGAGLQVVAMSATPREPGGLHLTDADLDDPELARRVRAGKAIEIVEVDDWRRDARAALVTRAREAAGRGTVGIFVNTVGMALAVAAELGADEGARVVLVCGRMRPADLDRIRVEHPGLLDARGNEDVDYLVTTQSLEVGVDLDLPAIVSEIAPASALAQRMGRLNRSGRRARGSFSVICPGRLDDVDLGDLEKDFAPYTGQAVLEAIGWLARLDGDASPERISSVSLPEADGLSVPSLSRADLETVAMTGVPLAADVDPAFYVEEPPVRDVPSVSIAARDHLPSAALTDDGAADGLGLVVVQQMLETVPPRAHELATMSVGKELKAILDSSPGSWILRTGGADRVACPLEDAGALRDGDVVVLPAGSRVLVHGIIGGGRGRAAAAIEDVMAARDPHEGPPDEVVRLPARDVRAVIEDDRFLGRRSTRTALAEVALRAGAASVAERLRRHRRLADLELTWCDDRSVDDGDGLLIMRSVQRAGQVPRTTVTHEGEKAVTIQAHAAAVRGRMARVIEALDSSEVDAVADGLLAAADLHDEGKRHPRFQSRMGADPADAAEPVAKPVPGHQADAGDGWRHEQLSAAVAAVSTDRDPLVVALVAAHHGHGRPLFDRDPKDVLEGWDPGDQRIGAELEGLFGDHGSYELLRGRLHQELGIHRLAYLEALLRCADMQVSREGG